MAGPSPETRHQVYESLSCWAGLRSQSGLVRLASRQVMSLFKAPTSSSVALRQGKLPQALP